MATTVVGLVGARHAVRRKAYDVVVAGGGLVGAAFANALAAGPLTRGLRVLVLEGRPPKLPLALPAEPLLRVSAVSAASRAVIERRGGVALDGVRMTPYDEMRVWDWTDAARLHWRAGDAGGGPELGHIVENDALQAALYEAMLARDGDLLEVAAGVTLAGVGAPRGDADGLELELSGGDRVSARLLVGADGPGSAVRGMCGIGAWGWSYAQSGVVATVRTEAPHSTAWQRFLPWGPLALLPAHENYSSIVWSTTEAHARRLCDGSVDLVAAVNEAFRMPHSDFGAASWARPLPPDLEAVMPVLRPQPGGPAHPPPATELVGRARSFPLRLQHASSYTARRVALIGDAAHVVHPLAGQGVNLGFADAEALADAVAGAVEAGQDVGSGAVLDAFAAGRTTANAPLVAGIHAVQRAFALGDGPAALMRTLAVSAIDAVPALKSEFARRAAGGARQ